MTCFSPLAVVSAAYLWWSELWMVF